MGVRRIAGRNGFVAWALVRGKALMRRWQAAWLAPLVFKTSVGLNKVLGGFDSHAPPPTGVQRAERPHQVNCVPNS
jgi:hypothetical protein